jgi:hypothetical protein
MTEQDKETASRLIAALKTEKAAGRLTGADIALKVENGVVWLKGRVMSKEQEQTLLNTAQSTHGVVKIMKNLEVGPAAETAADTPTAQQIPTTVPNSPVQTAATATPKGTTAVAASPAGLQKAGPTQPQLVPVNPYYAYPYAGYYAMPQTPVAFAPAQPASANVADASGAVANHAAAGGVAGPGGYPAAPIYPVAAGAPAVRYDHPHLPAYSWPSYASYPNYAAVTYPKVYSPTVWPYIGPFYPYPQVPLGWRKVTLEWDDGWWQLDFEDQNRPWKRR